MVWESLLLSEASAEEPAPALRFLELVRQALGEHSGRERVELPLLAPPEEPQELPVPL